MCYRTVREDLQEALEKQREGGAAVGVAHATEQEERTNELDGG